VDSHQTTLLFYQLQKFLQHNLVVIQVHNQVHNQV
jgi:hypothetical protein